MSEAYLKKMAEKYGKTLKDMEKIWDEAKEQAAKENMEENYAYITAIFKNMIGEKD